MPAASPIHIVFIEGAADIRSATVRLLTGAGMSVTDYASAESFLAYPPAAKVDCLLLDVDLGTMSGLVLQARLVAEGKAPPVVFLTARTEATYRIMARQLGSAAYLSKSDPDDEVIAAIRQAVAAGGMSP